MSIPTIETERLLLRGHSVDDLDPCAAMWADADVTRFIGGRPFSREEAWSKILRYRGHWALLGYGYWVVCDKGDGRFAGEVGFADFNRDISPSLDGDPELGWVLARHAQGKGFATEAVRAAVAWGERHLARRRQVCIIDPDNVASIHVARKCGFDEWARTSYKGSPSILYQRVFNA